MSKYKLSDNPIDGDIISNNIFKRRDKIYYSILNFNNRSRNDGVLAENILRLVIDGVNLNHLSKNHPHVDIAIVNPIDGFSKEDEIISVKSTISKRPTLKNLLSDTKSIKLDSMLSYITFINSNFDPNNYSYDIAKKTLKDSIELIKDSSNKDYKAVVNVVVYYLLNNPTDIKNLKDDINRIGDGSYDLKYGNFSNYRINVLRKLTSFGVPISLGAIFVKGSTCFIFKTKSISIGRYWENLLNIWIDKEFFDSNAVKYLRLEQVKKLFGIPEDGEFPIKIEISIGDYSINSDNTELSDVERLDNYKKRAKSKTKKLYVMTKFKDADFGDKQPDINNFFLKTIDVLEKNPSRVKSFNDFIDSLD